jgi:hypothetical protein
MTIMAGVANLRWDPYLMGRGSGFNDFWTKHLLQNNNRNLLYVLGKGFDPRMCNGLRAVLNVGGQGLRDCLLIEFDEGENSPSKRYEHMVAENMNILKGLMHEKGYINSKSVQMWSDEGSGRRRIGSRSAGGIFLNMSDFKNYTDIIIDISALPQGIFFPLIGKIMYLLDNSKKDKPTNTVLNLHIVVSEDSELDLRIKSIGIDDDASYIYGFGGNLEVEATAEIPKVWIPILGEGRAGHLERIYALVNPGEICPVLPSPSLNPRRGDDILIEYRELLFDQWHIEPKNIIYAQEQNPFEAYRQIHRTACHYNQVLEPLGGCKIAVSALSSKLLSLGALLASYDLKKIGMDVGLAHVETHGYKIEGTEDGNNIILKDELFTLLLVGECYEL